MPIDSAIIVFVITFLGVLIQSSIGIGLALFAAPLLYFIDPGFVPGPILISGFILSFLIVIRNRQSLQYKRVTPAIIARIPGSYVGLAILLVLPKPWLQIFFGATLLVTVVLSFRMFRIRMTKLNVTLAGFFSGLLGTATSIGGPPIALVYTGINPDKARGELAFYFLFSTPISIGILSFSGYMTSEDYQLTLLMMPGVISGFIVSKYAQHYLSESRFRNIILWVSAISACFLLCQGALSLLRNL